MVERIPVIYIAGMGRSGSTLLDILLGNLEGAVGVGEFTNFTDWLRGDDPCSCGSRISVCDLWGRVIEDVPDARQGSVVFGGGKLWTLRRVFRTLVIGRASGEGRAVAELNHALFASVRAATGAAVIVDSSKHLGRACELAMSPLFDVRVVHLIRDGRGVMWSRMKNIRRLLADHPEVQHLLDRHPERKVSRSASWTMRRWVALNAAIMLVGLVRLRKRYRLVRYEDLAEAPQKTVDSLAEWAGVASDEGRDEAGRVVHNIGGNLVRLRPIGEIRVDDEWRRKLGRRHKLAYLLNGGPIVAVVARVVAARRSTPSSASSR